MVRNTRFYIHFVLVGLFSLLFLRCNKKSIRFYFPPVPRIMSVNKFPTMIEESIKFLIEKDGYLSYNIDKVAVSTDGSSYLGEIYEVDVGGITIDGEKVMNLFVKVNNGGENITYISIDNIYGVELFAYKELSEVFAELQQDANIPSHEKYNFVKSHEGSSNEAIILENIARRGFKTCHRMDVVSFEFAEMSMKQLAKLHGLSFALQEKRPHYFDRKIKEMRYPLIFCNDWDGFVKSMINLTMQYIDADVKSRVENMYYKLVDKYAQFFEDDGTRRCICHGDYRTNNIMIKMNDSNITDLFVVDYQFLHYGCPTMDIIYFFFISTDEEFRNAHLSHLKDVYHETLRTFLEYFNIDVDSVYPRVTFEQDFKEKLDYGLTIGFALLPLALANEDDAPNITGELSGVSFQVNDVYKDRQRGMVEEFTKWGYM